MRTGANLIDESRVTPWVMRLLGLNAVILLLQQTVLTTPAFGALFRFDPLHAFDQPWTFFTYMFLHGGLLHLLTNSMGLFIFGPPVERRFGGTRFLTFYLYCGLCSAVFSLVLSNFMTIVPFLGASGAILGVAVAFAKLNPNAELMVFPLPMPVRAITLVWIFIAYDLVGLLLPGDNVAHIAHLGGLAGGWFYFAVRGMNKTSEPRRLPSMRPTATVGASRGFARQGTAPAPRPEAPKASAPPMDLHSVEALEIDRILDKMNAGGGIASLTPDERRFLDNVSRRKRPDQNH